MASVLTTTYQSHLHLAHLPAAQASQARASVAVAVRLGDAAAAHARTRTAFTDGLHLALLIAAGIVIAAATLLRGHDRAKDHTPGAASAEPKLNGSDPAATWPSGLLPDPDRRVPPVASPVTVRNTAAPAAGRPSASGSVGQPAPKRPARPRH